MKTLTMVLVVLITLLSIAAGSAKVLQAPQEVAFLQEFGLTSMLIIIYGLIQIIGAVLLTIPKSRRQGALVAISAFSLSTALIFIDGNYLFGVFSLIPILLTALIYWQTGTTQNNQ